MKHRLTLLLLSLLLSLSCFASPLPSLPSPSLLSLLLDWVKCPVVQNQPDYPTSFLAQCANISVPLIWPNNSSPSPSLFSTPHHQQHQEEEEETIIVGVKRIFATSVTPLQLFLIAGGPGESAADEGFEFVAMNLLNISLTLSQPLVPTIYLIDHRGTGMSSPLVCSRTALDWNECLSELQEDVGIPYYTQFSTTHAVLDFGYTISLVQQETIFSLSSSPSTYLHCVSYGTYVCNKYLTVQSYSSEPEAWPELKGVVLDGVIDSQHIDFHFYDEDQNAVGLELMARCEADAACLAKFEGTYALLYFNFNFILFYFISLFNFIYIILFYFILFYFCLV
jgi:hypothetical protein